jgi:predicted DNA-binding WGR domain protein
MSDLERGQAYVWPLTHDRGGHFKFYNILVRKVGNNAYRIVCSWGKINSKGRSTTITGTENVPAIMAQPSIYEILQKKKKKGYRLAKSTEYNVITERWNSYTLSLNSSDKLLKTQKKSSEDEKKDAASIRFDDLII